MFSDLMNSVFGGNWPSKSRPVSAYSMRVSEPTEHEEFDLEQWIKHTAHEIEVLNRTRAGRELSSYRNHHVNSRRLAAALLGIDGGSEWAD